MAVTTTLTAQRILRKTHSAMKKRVPLLSKMSFDQQPQKLMYNQTVTAHIRTLPTASTYVEGSGGYKNGAVESRSLLKDIPVTLDQWAHVPLKLGHEELISDEKLDLAIGDASYVLGKQIVDFALGKVVDANVTEETAETIADTDRETLGKVRKAMNQKGAFTDQRYGIANSDFMEALAIDNRIESKDFGGQDIGGDSLAVFRNLSGFREIEEYADMPHNSQNIQAVFYDPRGFTISTTVPDRTDKVADALGIPKVMSWEPITDPETKMTLMLVKFMEEGTGNIFVSVACIYGVSVGAQGEAAGSLTDYALHKVVTA